jgi:hypothetical protein
MFFFRKEVINMRISRFVSLVGLPTVPALAPFTAAHAQRPGLYLGAAWGAYSINESALDDNDDLLKAYIGGQFTNWFSIEGSWVDFDHLDRAGNRFEADGKGLAAVFSLPVSAHLRSMRKPGSSDGSQTRFWAEWRVTRTATTSFMAPDSISTLPNIQPYAWSGNVTTLRTLISTPHQSVSSSFFRRRHSKSRRQTKMRCAPGKVRRPMILRANRGN